MRGRRWVLPGCIWVLLMMVARNYLMAHYPSDVLFALLIGVFSGFVAAIITNLIYRFLEARSGDGKVYDFLLYAGFDRLPDFKSLGSKKTGDSAAVQGAHRPAHRGSRASSRHQAATHAASGDAKIVDTGYKGKH